VGHSYSAKIVKILREFFLELVKNSKVLPCDVANWYEGASWLMLDMQRQVKFLDD